MRRINKNCGLELRLGLILCKVLTLSLELNFYCENNVLGLHNIRIKYLPVKLLTWLN